MRSAYRVESAASDPPKPRLIAFAPSSGKEDRRSHRTMLEAPMKTMAWCGGGDTLSASSNFLIADSHRSDCAASLSDGAATNVKRTSATCRRRFLMEVFYAGR